MRNLFLLSVLLTVFKVAFASKHRGVRGLAKRRNLKKVQRKEKDNSIAISGEESAQFFSEDYVSVEESKAVLSKDEYDSDYWAQEAKEAVEAQEAPEAPEETLEAPEAEGKEDKGDKGDKEDGKDAAAAAAAAAAEEEETDIVNISIQPTYDGIPVFLGVELGLFQSIGLNVNISVWTAGGPQVAAAVEEDAWDFGVAGSVANIIAASQGISTVGISNDESSANQLVGAPGVTEFPPTGELSEGAFAVSPGTTADLMLRRCLQANGVNYDESHFLGGSQTDVMAALEGGNSTYGGLWAPKSYEYLGDNPAASEFCNAEAVGVTIPGGLMIRDEWGQQNPDLASKVLAVYLHGVSLMQNLAIREKILEHSRAFYDYVGENPSDDDIERDFLTRPTFNLDALLALMSRNFVNDNMSTLDYIYSDLSHFLVEQGTIEAAPPAESYLSDFYLQMISADPDLRFFAYGGYTAYDMGGAVDISVVSSAMEGGGSGGGKGAKGRKKRA